MYISQVIKILRIRCLQISWENDTCTIDENIGSAEFLDYSEAYVNQVLIVCKLSLDSQWLWWILLCDTVELDDVTANQAHSSSIIQIPMCQTSTNARRSTSENNDFMQEKSTNDLLRSVEWSTPLLLCSFSHRWLHSLQEWINIRGSVVALATLRRWSTQKLWIVHLKPWLYHTFSNLLIIIW